MFDFLPDWFKSILGCSVIVAIIVYGFILTTKKDSSGNGNTTNTKGQ